MPIIGGTVHDTVTQQERNDVALFLPSRADAHHVDRMPFIHTITIFTMPRLIGHNCVRTTNALRFV